LRYGGLCFRGPRAFADHRSEFEKKDKNPRACNIWRGPRSGQVALQSSFETLVGNALKFTTRGPNNVVTPLGKHSCAWGASLCAASSKVQRGSGNRAYRRGTASTAVPKKKQKHFRKNRDSRHHAAIYGGGPGFWGPLSIVKKKKKQPAGPKKPMGRRGGVVGTSDGGRGRGPLSASPFRQWGGPCEENTKPGPSCEAGARQTILDCRLAPWRRGRAGPWAFRLQSICRFADGFVAGAVDETALAGRSAGGKRLLRLVVGRTKKLIDGGGGSRFCSRPAARRDGRGTGKNKNRTGPFVLLCFPVRVGGNGRSGNMALTAQDAIGGDQRGGPMRNALGPFRRTGWLGGVGETPLALAGFVENGNCSDFFTGAAHVPGGGQSVCALSTEWRRRTCSKNRSQPQFVGTPVANQRRRGGLEASRRGPGLLGDVVALCGGGEWL